MSPRFRLPLFMADSYSSQSFTRLLEPTQLLWPIPFLRPSAETPSIFCFILLQPLGSLDSPTSESLLSFASSGSRRPLPTGGWISPLTLPPLFVLDRPGLLPPCCQDFPSSSSAALCPHPQLYSSCWFAQYCDIWKGLSFLCCHQRPMNRAGPPGNQEDDG